MKFTSVLHLTAIFMAFFITSVYPAWVPVREASENSLEVRDTTDDIREVLQPDGIIRYEFYSNGTLQASVIDNLEGGASVLDSDGNELPDNVNDKIEKRFVGALARLLWRFRHIIKRWGSRVAVYVKCVGVNTVADCGNYFIGCAQSGTAPWDCISGGICVGAAHRKCR